MSKRYKVIGSQPVLGDHQPGESFDATIPEDQEQYLVNIGAIKVVSTDPEHDKRLSDSSSKKKG